MNKILLAGVSAAAFALTASAALAFGDNTVGGNHSEINDNDSGFQANGNSNSGNTSNSNQNNNGSTNQNNSGLVAGGDNNVLSDNTTSVSGNLSNNTFNADNNLSGNTVENEVFGLAVVETDAGRNFEQSASFSHSGPVAAGVLDSQVTNTTVNFVPGAVDLLGNLTDNVANEGSGLFGGTQASSNTTFSNTSNAITVSVDSVHVGNGN